MASILNFANFTFSTEEIRAIKELVFDEVINAPEVEMFHTIYPGIVYNKEVGFIGKGSLVGVAGQGCGVTPQAYNIGTRKITWAPKDWEILIHECSADLEATAAIYSMETGIGIKDFTSTDYMNIVKTVLANDVKDFIIRLLWLSDTAAEVAVVEELPTAAATEQTTGQAIVGTVYAGVTSSTSGAVKCALANATVVYLAAAAATGNAAGGTTYYSKDTVNTTTVFSGGTLTPGTTEAFFTILDGFFKQMLTQATANPSQLVDIDANEGATYAAQELDPDDVQDILKGLVFGADLKLRGLKGNFILCTQKFYDAYELSLTGTSLSEMYYNITDKMKTLTYKGIPLVPVQTWDEHIEVYYNDGYKYTFGPNIAVMTNKAVLAVGVDSVNSFGEMDAWYSKDDRKVKIEAMGKADAKLANPSYFQIAI